MKIGILTSSRADFGIYLPLLKQLKSDEFFELEIIAFGTHLSSFYGETIQEIQKNGFEVKHTVESMILTDSPNAIASAIGLTTLKFADFWKANEEKFDLVFCLGDRYEMFAAVMAGIPFQISFAHIHGGETTLGAIDNVFRHAITLASTYHFVATETYAKKVAELISSTDKIYHVGALGLDNIADMELLTIEQFNDLWSIDLHKKTILTTFHPETVAVGKNEDYANELVDAINQLKDYQFLVTMPNADTAGNLIRRRLVDNFSQSDRVFLIENLGSKSYFSAMKYCTFLLGNTSSGIIEAASFGKYVINLGDRQKGRASGDNVINTPISSNAITEAVAQMDNRSLLGTNNIYDNKGAATKIINVLKTLCHG